MPLSDLSRPNRTTVPVSQMAGHHGVAIYGGYIASEERDPELTSPHLRYRSYAKVLTNCSVAAAAVRYYQNLLGGAEWSFAPSVLAGEEKPRPDAELYAARTEEALSSMNTPLHRVIRRAGLFRLYGFSIQEWALRRHDEGWMTISDISPRAQKTIERWDVEEDGTVLGVTQRSPQSFKEIYIPISKCLYIVDDSLNDSPEGLGLLRLIVQAAKRLREFERLEEIGFDADLRGTIVFHIPMGEIKKRIEEEAMVAGNLTQDDINSRINEEVKVYKDFVKNHVQSRERGIILDSAVFESQDEAGRPSATRKYDMNLLDVSSTTIPELAKSIERVNREIARVMGVEQLMLGEGSSGSFALSRDKTNAFYLMVEGALTEIRDQLTRDVIRPLFRLNGWPEEYVPNITTEAIQFTDVEAIAGALRDMATAGAPLTSGDPVIAEVRAMLGLSDPPEDTDMEGAMLLNPEETLAEEGIENG